LVAQFLAMESVAGSSPVDKTMPFLILSVPLFYLWLDSKNRVTSTHNRAF
jgi:hypothetical protein